ncbi:Mediator of RNA polymerase II transcription subunit 4 [Escovopsis weberi]|uniref:Mediator of RNA polymerase II transcription subunit 4 n=1 Tax=Escovopsis weberi TaxID=150374 RepID=A0A0N0RU78_ESCWE|nr:Mediator of RNA polymerase II transcription subunit 4 [Escovopsis weberi]
MDQSIDSRFERLEKALAALIDSVTKYHPSTTHAEELRAADQDLGRGLLEVQTHQNNYLRIQQLRRLSASLDAQIRETLISLAATRKDIVTTQTTSYPPGDSYPVTYGELLQYARRISKTTMPPASALSSVPPPPPQQQQQQQQAPPAQPAPAGSSSASASANGLAQQQQQQQSGAESSAQPASMHTSLPDGMSQYLNPLSGQIFFPWPPEDKIRSGALASNQILSEQGIDPRGFDPVLEEDRRRREEEERKEREEREKQERADKERAMREEMERIRLERERQREKEQAEWRRASVAGASADAPGAAARGAPGAGEKKQFQFTNLDDLDDDDDDDDD